ncbi:thioredoxin [Candidatus Gracilibacteria bacterium GN02-872]|nr:thioredoxin [Candidatus Gracilibacteria bacterium GN02-872]RKW24585.1 MAG: thioredoxin [Candidatus Gracilibacteria bacterium]
MTLILNNENFNETIKEGVTLVDFWAEWCGPCQMMLPIIDDFAESQGDSMKVGKVNVDECPEIAGSFRVMSIPTLIVFKDGEVVETMVGVKQKSELEEVVSKYL